MFSFLRVVLLAFASVVTLGAAAPETLRLARIVPLPEVSGRFDHFAIDAAGMHLFVAALGHDTVEVIDLDRVVRLHSIRGLHKPTGLAYLPESGKLAVANGGDGTLRFFDGQTFAPTGQLGSLDDADNLRLDPGSRRLYVGFGAGVLGNVDTAAMKFTDRIELKGHPESFQLERAGTRIFVNIPDARMVAVVDREKRAVVAHWPMKEFSANYPMALDEARGRLFVGCRQPARLVVFDLTGRRVADLEISGDTDDLFFDPKRQRLYLSCGEGFIDVIQCSAGDRYERIERLPTRAGARTCYFSAETDQLTLAVPQTGDHDAELRVYQPN